MVIGLFNSLASLVKYNYNKPTIANRVFQLHYKFTTFFCFVACGLVVTSDFIGKAIQCLDADATVTTACWVSSTYTLNTTKENGFYHSHGSNFHGHGTYDERKHEKRYHAYYQWVPLVLFLQGVLFYLPYFVWKYIEGKQISTLLDGVRVFLSNQTNSEKIDNIVRYMMLTAGTNAGYYIGYISCEVLNLVNIIGQMMMMDRFFGGMFWDYGTKVLFLPLESDENRNDAMVYTFPRVTKCDFFKYGSSGTLENKDYLCILPQNLLNEKIFLILWIWFMFLLIVSSIELVLRSLSLMLPQLRVKMIEKRGKMTKSNELGNLIRGMDIGDFYLLHILSWNIDTLSLRELLERLIDCSEPPDTSPRHVLTIPSYFKAINFSIRQRKKTTNSE